jgi:predicted DNA-binding protein (MmcQ/YjbR family)
MADVRRVQKALLKYALNFPEAYEDHPWGETVAKVNKKVFVFLGAPAGAAMGLCVKLPTEGDFARSLPYCTPAGYGLGKAGWVMASFAKGDDPPVDMLKEWIDESYRAVAPKKLIKLLET